MRKRALIHRAIVDTKTERYHAQRLTSAFPRHGRVKPHTHQNRVTIGTKSCPRASSPGSSPGPGAAPVPPKNRQDRGFVPRPVLGTGLGTTRTGRVNLVGGWYYKTYEKVCRGTIAGRSTPRPAVSISYKDHTPHAKIPRGWLSTQNGYRFMRPRHTDEKNSPPIVMKSPCPPAAASEGSPRRGSGQCTVASRLAVEWSGGAARHNPPTGTLAPCAARSGCHIIGHDPSAQRLAGHRA